MQSNRTSGSRARVRRRSFALLALLTLASGAAAQTQAPQAPQALTIAVMPFKNLKSDKNLDWLGDAAADTLATKLASVPELVLVERTQLHEVLKEQDFQKLDVSDPQSAVRAGKLLGAGRIVVGTYVGQDGDVQFNVRVVDVSSSEVLNASNVTGKLKDIFDTLNTLAEAVVDSFNKKVTIVDARPTVVEAPPPERIVLADDSRRTLHASGNTTVEAYEAYGKGLHATAPQEQLDFFSLAIKTDSSFFQAYVARGDTHVTQGHLEMAIDDYDAAIRKNPRCSEAYYRKGEVYERMNRPRLAVAAYKKCMEIAPGKTSRIVEKAKNKLKNRKENRNERDDDARPRKRP